MFLAATSDESHEFAGREGLGVMSNSNFAGFERQGESIAAYHGAIDARVAEGGHCNRSAGTLIFVAHCAETREKAYEEAQPILREYLPTVVSSMANMAKYSQSYAYMGRVAERVDEIVGTDSTSAAAIQNLIDTTATMVLGDPDDCIEQIERFAAVGIDDIILRLDTVPHAQLMKSIELFGKYVIPHFNDRAGIAQSMDENVAAIRARREERKAPAAVTGGAS
jgi:alkanesulfonate monooxygenase SsuD/methylene tetrahydromethanopterin reductase-like flavin-dependent oxidoreductase (luciferase family)